MSAAYQPNLLHFVEETLYQTVRKHALPGEDVRYAVSMTVLPGAEPGTFVPVMVVALTMASPNLGERIFSNRVSDDLHPTEEVIDQFVQAMVESMRAQRTEILSTVTV